MLISKAEAHSRAVVSIQALLSKHRPGTNFHLIAELALDLAFNGSVPGTVDFESELIADARLLIRKQVAARLRPSLLAITPLPNFRMRDPHYLEALLRQLAHVSADSSFGLAYSGPEHLN